MTSPKRAAVYCRISDDRRGTELGVERQATDGLALVERRGFTLVPDGEADAFIDNDISAFSGKSRPAFERMMAGVRAGEVDVIVAWHPDRLHRRPLELEALITLIETTKTGVETVLTGDYNLNTANGRQMARIGVAIANGESDHKSERIRRAVLQRAEQGKVHGALRTYGMQGTRQADGTHTWEVIPEEAAVIREAAERVLAGDTLLGIVLDLNARGVPTMRNKSWTRNTLRGILVSARVAGWREHTVGRTNGNVVGLWGGGEFVAEAEWPAILTRAQVEALRRKLTGIRPRGASRVSYLLSNGLVRCQCGAPMRGRPNSAGSRDYSCASPTSNGVGCGKVSIRSAQVDEYVLALVRERIQDGAWFERLAQAEDDSDGPARSFALVTELEGELSGLADDYGQGRITRAEWMAARGPLTTRLDRARRELTRHDDGDSLAVLAGGIARWDAEWSKAEGNVDRRRAMLRAVLASVTIGPGSRGGNRLDNRRITLTWQG